MPLWSSQTCLRLMDGRCLHPNIGRTSRTCDFWMLAISISIPISAWWTGDHLILDNQLAGLLFIALKTNTVIRQLRHHSLCSQKTTPCLKGISNSVKKQSFIHNKILYLISQMFLQINLLLGHNFFRSTLNWPIIIRDNLSLTAAGPAWPTGPGDKHSLPSSPGHHSLFTLPRAQKRRRKTNFHKLRDGNTSQRR